MENNPKEIGERFWSKVDITDKCWNWTAAVDDHGYGVFGVGGRRENGGSIKKAHRVMYEFVYGPIPDGLQICHHCDNPKCVNPKHFFLGTHITNSRDARKKGRLPYGERHYASKLTEEIVAQIRESEAPQKELANKFGVSVQQISKIQRGERWNMRRQQILDSI